MAVGEPVELRAAVGQLLALDPSPLLGTRGQSGISQVRLQAWAVDVAAELHRRFPDLELVVGFLRYPQRVLEQHPGSTHVAPHIPELDPRIGIALDGPLRVASGYDGHHRVVITNHISQLLSVWTNGQITAHVVDPATAETVGGSPMAQVALGRRFLANAGEDVVVPLLVGTASSDPRLGYSIPPGTWQLRAVVTVTSGNLPDRHRYLTPAMQFEIV